MRYNNGPDGCFKRLPCGRAVHVVVGVRERDFLTEGAKMASFYGDFPREQLCEGIGERLRGLRKAKGLPLRRVHEATGVDQGSIWGYEMGHNPPNVPALIALADFYGVSCDYICGREK